ncbi:MAG: vitamin K epoxide reductase family protein [Deltaproteobacteria bacterium]
MNNKNALGVFAPILAGLGLAVSAYLTFLYFTGAEASLCITGSGCDAVRNSQYSAIASIPVPILGIAGYGAILALCLMPISERARWRWVYFLSLAGAAFSAYLTYVELFVIKSVCFYCVVSAAIIAAIFILSLLKKGGFAAGLRLAGISAAVVAATIGLSFAFAPEPIETEANAVQVAVAKHLGGMGAVMYGSFQCPHCSVQKQLFGEKVFKKYIGYVECHPRGESADTQRCYDNGITSYPTWEIAGRYYLGTKSLRELAEISKFRFSEPPGS